jgi:hypothetical protein
MNKLPTRKSANGVSGRARQFAAALDQLANDKKILLKLVGKQSRGARHVSLTTRLYDHLQIKQAMALAEPLASAAAVNTVVCQRDAGVLIYQFQLSEGLWEWYTRANLPDRGPGVVGVGLSDKRRQVNFNWERSPHAGFFGTTGSGKTTGVLTTLTGLFQAYAPNELQAVILDPKHDYVVFHNVAHLAYPVATQHEEMERAMALAHQEYRRRLESNDRRAGRFLVIIEEAETTLSGDLLRMARDIAAVGRTFNFCLVIISQKPKETDMPGVLDKVTNRWVGFVDNAQSSAYLTGHAGIACHKLSGRGDFVHIDAGVQERLQIAMPTQADYDAIPRGAAEPVWHDEPGAVADLVLDDEDEDDDGPGPGRPSIQIEPELVAYYQAYGPDKVSRSQARDALGLKRRAHEIHQDFARRERAEIKRLLEVRRK